MTDQIVPVAGGIVAQLINAQNPSFSELDQVSIKRLSLILRYSCKASYLAAC